MSFMFRSYVLVGLVLGTLCLATKANFEEEVDPIGSIDTFEPLSYDQNPENLEAGINLLPPTEIKELWEKAASLYNINIVQQFKNGNQSDTRRGIKSTPFSEEYDDYSNIFHIYSEYLASKHNMTKMQASGIVTLASCTNPSTSQCASFINTNPKYRTINGTCNNVNNPVWGATNRAFNRVLQPAYDDGFDSPRGGFGTNKLPNTRVISVTVHPDNVNAINKQITNMVPQFGEFLGHDMTLTPVAASPCCTMLNSNPANCWPISVENDAFYLAFTKCLDFTRSTPCQSGGIRQQMNANTAYIDASQIYGSDTNRSTAIRGPGGMLRTNWDLDGFLPLGSSLGIQSKGDFVSGDNRVNENPALIAMHIVWLREHNRIATIFNQISDWSDEKIYQETRRIVIAELEQVTYNEYLPIVLGPAVMHQYNLGVRYFSTYNSSVDSTITNEFATAAYRFGHSLVAGVIELQFLDGFINRVVGSYHLADEYFQSKQVTRNSGQGFDLILRGLMRQNSPDFDRFLTPAMLNYLYKPQNLSNESKNFGSDVAAINIQRGRDHGLRPYNDYRVACGGTDLTNVGWGRWPRDMNPDGWKQASRVYARPIDMDLFTGGLIEIKVALTGPTFTCLMASQFSRTKFGDRFFFTHKLPTGFTAAQLANLSLRRFGDVICENSKQNDTTINVFLTPDFGNPSIPCRQAFIRTQLDLKLYL